MSTTDDLYASPCTHATEPTLISFEVMPPRTPTGADRFWRTVDDLLSIRPDFMSVTYGAGGKDRTNARAVVERLVRDTPIQPIAHLTCVGNTSQDVVATVYDTSNPGCARSWPCVATHRPTSRTGLRPRTGFIPQLSSST